MHWYEPTCKAFRHFNLQANIQTFKAHIDQHVINYLEMTSEILSLKAPEKVISHSSLEGIKTLVSELIKEVKNSDAPESLKLFMTKLLYQLKWSIDEYHISGINQLSNTIEQAFGHAVLHPESVQAAKNCSEVNKFWGFMIHTATVLTILTNTAQLAAPIVSMLTEAGIQTEVQVQDNSDDVIEV